MQDVEIIASSYAVPGQVVSNDQLASFMDTSDEWIKKRTGIKKRHISSHENTSDLAIRAIKKMIMQGCKIEEVGLIIVATMSPDNMTPSTSCLIQGKLGAKNAVCFDLSAACSGFSYALSVAKSMMICQNIDQAIVVGSEVLSKLIDWTDRSSAVLFGDGAGAVWLKRSDQKHVLAEDLASFGDLGDKLVAGHTEVKTDFRENSRQFSAFKMDGRRVYQFATHQVPLSIERAVQKANLELNSIDHFILHQANYRIIEQVAKKLKQPLSKFASNIGDFGNTAAASEAILLAQLIEKKIIKQGDKVVLSGFGGGLTTATIIIEF